jgi:hypothetical protein
MLICKREKKKKQKEKRKRQGAGGVTHIPTGTTRAIAQTALTCGYDG